MVFLKEQEDTCTLLSTDYRLGSCSTISSPTFRPGEDNIFAACQEAIAGSPNTCEGFIEESCTMDTEPEVWRKFDLWPLSLPHIAINSEPIIQF